jgi:hypothetical protein
MCLSPFLQTVLKQALIVEALSTKYGDKRKAESFAIYLKRNSSSIHRSKPFRRTGLIPAGLIPDALMLDRLMPNGLTLK